jgi:hypothetical protein
MLSLSFDRNSGKLSVIFSVKCGLQTELSLESASDITRGYVDEERKKGTSFSPIYSEYASHTPPCLLSRVMTSAGGMKAFR